MSTPGPAYHTWDISEDNNMGTGAMEEMTTTRLDIGTDDNVDDLHDDDADEDYSAN